MFPVIKPININRELQELQVSIQRRFIGYGEHAAKKTMQIMSNTIHRASEVYYVRRWAEILSQGNSTSLIENLWDNLTPLIRYVRDIDGLETLTNPVIVLQRMDEGEIPALDCDCMTILVLTLARAIGYPVAIRSIEDVHVYGLVYSKNGWLAVDLVKPENGIGWEYTGAKLIRTLQV